MFGEGHFQNEIQKKLESVKNIHDLTFVLVSRTVRTECLVFKPSHSMVFLLGQLKWTKVVLYGVVVLYALNTPETKIEYWKCLLSISLLQQFSGIGPLKNLWQFKEL